MAYKPPTYGLQSGNAYGYQPRTRASSVEPNIGYHEDKVQGPSYQSPYGVNGMPNDDHYSALMKGMQAPERVDSKYKAQTIAPVGPVDYKPAHDAAYGRAKDDAAATAQSAMSGLSGMLAQRGMGGGGFEANGIGQELSRSANTIGAAGRAQAESEFQAENRNNEFNANLALDQRGQDYDWQKSLYSGDIAQRGQDIDVGEFGMNADLNRRGQDLGRMNHLDSIESGLRQSGYQGAIQQRGQDYDSEHQFMDRKQGTDIANLQGQISQRGQDLGDDASIRNYNLQGQRMAYDAANAQQGRQMQALQYALSGLMPKQGSY